MGELAVSFREGTSMKCGNETDDSGFQLDGRHSGGNLSFKHMLTSKIGCLAWLTVELEASCMD